MDNQIQKNQHKRICMSALSASSRLRNQSENSNQFEMLTFSLQGKTYGVNVFKTKEILPFQAYTRLPHQSDYVTGIISVRGQTMPLFDLSKALGHTPLKDGTGVFIVTELNRNLQAIWVEAVEHIHHISWSDVSPPPSGIRQHHLTAVAKTQKQLIGILDLESLLFTGQSISEDMTTPTPSAFDGHLPVLVVDDSRMARGLITRCIQKMGGDVQHCCDGLEAWRKLKEQVAQHGQLAYSLIVTDIEMPQMDGYTLTQHIKSDPNMMTTPVLLHSSLSGEFNVTLSAEVGADFWLSKFNADELQQALISALSTHQHTIRSAA
jgi:two-component system, chemotaxis family, chemotaxis protein CheV